jgi:DNA-binding GntR family transcriptional regulator
VGVRRAILRGELVAGQRLIEPDLAEMLGVNRSSVRAALIDLAAEGLVQRMLNTGARVRIVPVAEAIAINECRRVLDGLCAAKAADCASDEESRPRSAGRSAAPAITRWPGTSTAPSLARSNGRSALRPWTSSP